MDILAYKLQETQTTIAIFFCVALFMCGYNLCPIDELPDLPSVLFLSYMVLHLQSLSSERFVPNIRLLMFPIYLSIMYLLTQIAMFLMWNPFWHMQQVVINWLMDTKYALKLHNRVPRLYFFLRNDSAYIIKLVTVLHNTFSPLKEYFMPSELSYQQLADLTRRFDYPEIPDHKACTKSGRTKRRKKKAQK